MKYRYLYLFKLLKGDGWKACASLENGVLLLLFLYKKHKERKKGGTKSILFSSSTPPKWSSYGTPQRSYIYRLFSLALFFFYSLFLLAFIRSSFLTRIPPTRRIVVRGKRREEESWAKRRTPIDPCDERRGAVPRNPCIYTYTKRFTAIVKEKKSVAAQSNEDSS